MSDLSGWDVISAEGERVGTVAAVHEADRTIEVALTLPGTGGRGAARAAEELRAAARGSEAPHVRSTDQRPVGGDLLGDVNPAPGAHHGSPEEPVRPPGVEDAVRDRVEGAVGGRRVLLPLGAVRIDREGRRVVALELASHELAALQSAETAR